MPKTTLDRDDLLAVYDFTYASFAVTPQEVADSIDHVNTKYARQLLADLIKHDLVAISEGDEGDVWQTIPSYDDMSHDEARAKFDAAYPVAASTSTSSGSSKSHTEVGAACLCGCGEKTGKSNYRPGHDARHAGQVGRAIAANYSTPGFDRRDLLAVLPSDALKAKAEGIAEKAIEKAEAKIQRDRAKQGNREEGTIKVGKNEYAATRLHDGSITYFVGNEERTASKTAAKTFTV